MRKPTFTNLRPLAVLVVGLLVYAAINPLRIEHFVLFGLFAALAAACQATRDLAIALVPAGLFGLMYDLLRVFADHAYRTVIIKPTYRLEQTLFGWLTPRVGDVGPVDFFAHHHYLGADLLGGFWYSTHVPAVILFGLYLWWRQWRPNTDDRRRDGRLHKFMWGYLTFNVIGFVIWVCMPVAPPWYVMEHGFAAPAAAIPGDPAALARVDAWLGYPHFKDIYAQATYVFGAMPSLHVAPSFWIAMWTRKTPLKWAGWLYAGTMSFFAVYLGHHYMVDIVAGAALAGAVYLGLAHTRLGRWPDRAAEAIGRSLDEI